MGKTKTRAELEAENRLLRRIEKSRGAAFVIGMLIRYSALVLCVRYGYLTVASLAGKSTLANIVVSALADVRVSETIAWLFGAGGTLFGFAQRRFRKKTVERLSARNMELEKSIDPRRTSSALLPTGDTRPEDES